MNATWSTGYKNQRATFTFKLQYEQKLLQVKDAPQLYQVTFTRQYWHICQENIIMWTLSMQTTGSTIAQTADFFATLRRADVLHSTFDLRSTGLWPCMRVRWTAARWMHSSISELRRLVRRVAIILAASYKSAKLRCTLVLCVYPVLAKCWKPSTRCEDSSAHVLHVRHFIILVLRLNMLIAKV